MPEVLSDVAIAQKATKKPITEIAKEYNIPLDSLELYGPYKAKLSFSAIKKLENENKDGKLVLVTAINPTPAGEGKTMTSIGITQALNKIGKKAIVTLREPSLGPVFGVKGGAAGGGYSQVIPMEDINLHFTGDMHAITAANNLLSAAIDNHIQQGNSLKIDVRNIVWKRVIDMNDRALRNIVIGLGGKAHGYPREDHCMITVASEVMAILCLSTDLMDLKKRLGEIIIGYNTDGDPVFAKELKVQGAMAVLLKDAIKPNLVQTLDNTLAIIHGGPFANIAHGCNSIIATKTGLKLGDILVTEAGFGADLGAEKFFDIKCRFANLKPDAVVVVATIRALKMHGGVAKDELNKENLEALKAGFANLKKHLDNMKKFNVPAMVAINRFSSDTEKEIQLLIDMCKEYKVEVALNECWAKGGDGAIDAANKLVHILENEKSDFKPLYDEKLPIIDKLNIICKDFYGASEVVIDKKAMKEIKKLEEIGKDKLPICMAKTQYSLSDDPNEKGVPTNFKINIQDVRVSSGAGFIVCQTSNIMVMPGLPRIPAAEKIDINENGEIIGLF